MMLTKKFVLSIILVFCNIKLANAVFDIEFYNVGQGHCVIARSTKHGILIIDAGSSSTIGVKEVTNKNAKNIQLSSQIFDSIKNDLEKGRKLNLIITHADKDHLNLVKPILDKILNLPLYKGKYDAIKSNMKAIFGGNKEDYSSKEAKQLLKFIKDKIPFIFGSDFTEDHSTLLWNPPKEFTFDASDPKESVEFLSVNRAVNKLAGMKRPSDEDEDYEETSEENDDDEDTNATSIVVKLNGGGRSFMITGDKTISEIGTLIGKYRKKGILSYLKSDVFLATHHGSENDFSPSWMQHVNPSYLVVSAGTSSFFHPRPAAVCSKDIVTNLDKVAPLQPWHPIRAHGALSSKKGASNAIFYSDDRLIPFASGNTDNFRSTPYSYSMTNLGIYVTADQGTIKFSFDTGKPPIITTKHDGKNNFDEALKEFLKSEKDNLTTLAIRPPGTFSNDLISFLNLCNTLENLDISEYPTDDSHVDNIVELITNLKSLSVLKMIPNKLSEENKEKIRKAWGYKGLYL